MSYRIILLAVGLGTLILNYMLTMYMGKIVRRVRDNNSRQVKRVVTFQLPHINNQDILSTVILEEKDETLEL